MLFAENIQSRVISYNEDWRDAFLKYDHVTWDQCNLASRTWLLCVPKIRKYDFIVLLHSTNSNADHLTQLFKKALQYRKGKLLIFIGNEYKLIPGKLDLIKEIDADFVASQLPQDRADWLYEGCSAKTLSVPHGLNPEVFYSREPLSQRPIDIGERSAEYPWYLGDIDRNKIVELLPQLVDYGFNVDCSHDDAQRFDRQGWARFLSSCKATVTTEAGSSFLERDDRTRLAVNKYINENSFCTFSEVYKLFFANYRNAVSGKIISPRHFDAVGTKTCQVMFPGRFNDILQPDDHYIPLLPDLTNLADVAEKLRDMSFLQRMVDRTHEYILDAHTHNHRVQALMNIVNDSF